MAYDRFLHHILTTHSCLSRTMASDTSVVGELLYSKHIAAPSAKITSTDNAANSELSSH